MQIFFNSDLNTFTTPELCRYIEVKFYNQIQLHCNVIKLFIDDCKIDYEVFDLLTLLFNKFEMEINRIIKNDSLILFQKMIHLNFYSTEISLDKIKKKHSLIIELLQKIRVLFNNYIYLPSWNINTKLISNEFLELENTINNCIFIKENFLWIRIQNHSNAN
jgi:hypothetical protein